MKTCSNMVFENLDLDTGFAAYACRQPGHTHGPVRTDETCLLIEFYWYPDKDHGAD